jgi:hypothetical protein
MDILFPWANYDILGIIKNIYVIKNVGIPRWWLERGSRKHAS